MQRVGHSLGPRRALVRTDGREMSGDRARAPIWRLAVAAGVLVVAPVLAANPGDLDPTFNGGSPCCSTWRRACRSPPGSAVSQTTGPTPSSLPATRPTRTERMRSSSHDSRRAALRMLRSDPAARPVRQSNPRGLVGSRGRGRCRELDRRVASDRRPTSVGRINAPCRWSRSRVSRRATPPRVSWTRWRRGRRPG